MTEIFDDVPIHRLLREQGAGEAPVPYEGYVHPVVEESMHREVQEDGERVRFWAQVPELGGRYLRVITLEDEQTIHNAFPDRRFKP